MFQISPFLKIYIFFNFLCKYLLQNNPPTFDIYIKGNTSAKRRFPFVFNHIFYKYIVVISENFTDTHTETHDA